MTMAFLVVNKLSLDSTMPENCSYYAWQKFC